ncbi:hypothetical protein QN372_05915 [Undibacterium sp. RTI2.1]|uniref:hypothetical protein n=1 Tax=unclassified Undibacterium TaxID=2630295 RepID=UPI002AB4FD65|nr:MULTISPECIES: hypothetical protein [unclassified Undibacterium]MDY7538657.1 hypothetical protein [Undibacterium sp. 5I1]MEB0030274.1 hypothetical protein [Undibacterium sp. RTI2.1]MEB0116898.1 hypothetical protein [Undibacterium sp. RTI2.2]MEB0232146.1 hypothetical protein [Undibacterium sp. 10I3]MEB0259460.1 hypothetical protein [Undibacterium sp. 5I1]
MNILSKLFLLSLSVVPAFSANAAPADWYKWRSKIDTAEVCSQISPGAGWERTSGPFKNAQCEKLKY